jgi:hypothetical protein
MACAAHVVDRSDAADLSDSHVRLEQQWRRKKSAHNRVGKKQTKAGWHRGCVYLLK